MIAVDLDSEAVIGLVGGTIWTREAGRVGARRQRAFVALDHPGHTHPERPAGESGECTGCVASTDAGQLLQTIELARIQVSLGEDWEIVMRTALRAICSTL